MGAPITPTRAPSRAKSPERNLLPFRKKDFSGFFPEPFPKIITTAVIITATLTVIIIIITITAIIISGTPIKVKALPFKETF